MKKYCSIILFIFSIILATSCNWFNGSSNKIIHKDLDSIITDGKLKALINYSSTSYFIYKGAPMGFEYELLKKYADHIKVELEVIPIKNMDSIFFSLNKGVGDVVAANLTITPERLKDVQFTHPIIITKEVLIQRKPDDWRKLKKAQLQKSLLQSPKDLINKSITVREGSSFYTHLKDLSDQIGGPININTVPGETTMELLIAQVSDKEIDYTVADKNIAVVNQWQYPNIDANLVIRSDQRIAMATRINSDSLTTSMNKWLLEYQKTKNFKMLYNKYFNNQAAFNKRVSNRYYTLISGNISPYDELIKKHAPKTTWDWELFAALIYQESHFNNDAIGWGGAFGLMQFMPETGAKFGVDSSSSAEANIIAGTKYINNLNKIWETNVTDSLERIKFILASYNVGLGHVLDAQKLAVKYGKNPTLWEDVGYYLLHKSEPKYYNDDVVEFGYCKGFIVYDYVNEIIERYTHYKNMIIESELAKQ
ncbi:MAG: lytic transglycosylase F [Flavobacteriales bacterium CG_4_10_14_0_2_um_filter_32_8]|nr:MAG: lytic transglycosylase F [Flavobacteriales bacterium CG_4_10_14_0_2_um_filter_32_8]PJB14860.1 MAG: lytic transglycosylase F [Flavobacteriales bacterium CG_4_9_14_3_um_filter_32_8]